MIAWSLPASISNLRVPRLGSCSTCYLMANAHRQAGVSSPFRVQPHYSCTASRISLVLNISIFSPFSAAADVNGCGFHLILGLEFPKARSRHAACVLVVLLEDAAAASTWSTRAREHGGLGETPLLYIWRTTVCIRLFTM